MSTEPPGVVDTQAPPPDIAAAAADETTREAGDILVDQVTADAGDAEEPEGVEDLTEATLRVGIAVAFPLIGAAVMVGGIFSGAGGRVYAALGGLLGLALGAALARVQKVIAANVLVVVGLFAIGLVMVVPSGIDNVINISGAVGQARAAGDVLRPPVDLSPGWQAILGWLMGLIGFTVGWVAVVLRRPATALLLPLPIAAMAGISVPDEAQVPSGIAVLVMFALGMGLLSGSQSAGEGDERPSVAFEVRRTLRALPLIGVIVVALTFLSQANFLFPPPVIDPTQEAQKPQTVPLSEVEDRVLFEVESSITGPWRIGSLDVYDGTDWRLPPFADNQLDEVPRDGVVDPDLEPGVRATFRIKGLSGAVLPGLPNTVGIVASGPKLAYDVRNGNIRTAEGQIKSGLEYTVAAAALPAVDDLRQAEGTVGPELAKFAEIPDPPPGVSDLIAEAPNTSKWDSFDYLRTWILDNVTVTGAGVPASVTPQRVAEMIEEKEGSPFEIVAAQAMMARWVGIPSRIGYGFDGGEEAGEGVFEVRPKHGASFPEVYFPGFKWLPVIGTPKNAKASVGSDEEQQFDPTILPSNDISVQLFLPVPTPPPSILIEQIRNIVLVVVPSVLLLLLSYFTWPAARKMYIRRRRRRAAIASGPRARVALAYAEWRDYCTDFGYRFDTDTPLMFLDRFVIDEEHNELAWLVTRGLWGDLEHELDVEHAAAAEELSRTLRRRLAQAHPATLRSVAAVSRLSLRHPFAPETDLTRRRLRVPSRRRPPPAPPSEPVQEEPRELVNV
jgi:hypothetical protein